MVPVLGGTHNSEHLSRLHSSRHLASTIVHNVRDGVESLVDSVSGISPDNAVSKRLDDLLDLVADVSEGNARLADRNSLLHRLLRGRYQVRGLLVDLADRIRGVKISVEATVV